MTMPCATTLVWRPLQAVCPLLTLPVRGSAVQLATWVKKTFALRPALNRIRRQRPEQRDHQSDQVEGMF